MRNTKETRVELASKVTGLTTHEEAQSLCAGLPPRLVRFVREVAKMKRDIHNAFRFGHHDRGIIFRNELNDYIARGRHS